MSGNCSAMSLKIPFSFNALTVSVRNQHSENSYDLLENRYQNFVKQTMDAPSLCVQTGMALRQNTKHVA